MKRTYQFFKLMFNDEERTFDSAIESAASKLFLRWGFTLLGVISVDLGMLTLNIQRGGGNNSMFPDRNMIMKENTCRWVTNINQREHSVQVLV